MTVTGSGLLKWPSLHIPSYMKEPTSVHNSDNVHQLLHAVDGHMRQPSKGGSVFIFLDVEEE